MASPVSTAGPDTYGIDLYQELDESMVAASSGSLGFTKEETPLSGDGSGSQQLASTACTTCRTSHLKCDRQYPCSRCRGLGLSCTYMASRRGYNRFQPGAARPRDQRPRFSPIHKGAHGPGGASQIAQTPAGTPRTDAFSLTSPFTLLDSPSPAPDLLQAQIPGLFGAPNDLANAGLDLGLSRVRDPGRQLSSPDECISSFYRYFYASHPFVPPEEVLLRLAAQGLVNPLFSAMRWAGSCYIDEPSAKESLFDEAFRLVQSPLTPRDAFLVQAMMVLVIGLDGAGQFNKGKELLNDAKDLALEIGLNTRAFAVLHGQGVPVLEESWRRTWWELFILDGMFAGIHRVTDFTLFDLPADVALPCEEWQYLSGVIPPPKYLHDIDDGDFLDDEAEFSSLAYCILCAYNLGRLLKAQPVLGSEDEDVPRIEALLAGWRLCLPLSKRNAVGGPDEVIFKAHMILHATSILLHYPLSDLDPSHTGPIRSCSATQLVTSGRGFNSHTRHAIASANEISRLITHPRPLMAHTPFFTCVVALSSIVHLNRWGICGADGDDDEYFLRQRIRLNIGALGELSRVWRSAGAARDQVRGVAREIHLAKKERQTVSELWDGFVAEEMITGGAAGEAMMEVEVRGGLEEGQSY